MSIFKSGSIRGTYGKDWDIGTVFRIGYYLPSVIGGKKIVIGRDGRLSSPEIFDALSEGLVYAGCEVTDIGMIDTPGLVFSNINYGFDGSVMITASHNPPEDNGMKISGKGGLVISGKSGLKDIENLVRQEAGEKVAGGSIKFLDIKADYLSVFTSYMGDVKEGLKCVVDCSNGMASVLVRDIVSKLPGNFTVINDEIDGKFPAHGPNPTVESNLEQLKSLVLLKGADLGVCFDGDGDRMIVVDEKGRWVSPDLITAFLGLYYFKHFPDKRGGRDGVLYDARSSNSIAAYISELGGRTYISATGHTAMQEGLPSKNGIYGGELPGHYYYHDFFNLDNGWIPFLQVLSILSLEKKPLSEIIMEINRYYFSGEINFDVPEGSSIVEDLKERYSSGKQSFLDGVRVDYDNWWFLVRMANTEPVLRLVVEAESSEILSEKVAELKKIIYSKGGSDHKG